MGANFVSNTIKEYPKMLRIYIYKEPLLVAERGYSDPKPKKQVDLDFEPSQRSIYRTRMLISDLVLSNEFDLFCTFTFDPKKIDRYNYSVCVMRMTRWLSSQKNNSSPDLKYLVVPERHKDGAYHFHALLANFQGKLKKTRIRQKGREIYNLTGFRSGFSTAVKIDNREAVANYVKKYITKEMVKLFNRRRFLASRNLERPKKYKNVFGLSNYIDLAKSSFSDFDRYWIFSVKKEDVDQKFLDSLESTDLPFPLLSKFTKDFLTKN